MSITGQYITKLTVSFELEDGDMEKIEQKDTYPNGNLGELLGKNIPEVISVEYDGFLGNRVFVEIEAENINEAMDKCHEIIGKYVEED